MERVGNLGYEKWVVAHAAKFKYVALSLLLVSLTICCLHWGMASGTLTFFIILMTVASLVIILAPLGIVNYRFLALTVVTSFICEILFM
ncbi:hypothetical protein ACNR9Q_06025 [Maribacter sp. X9]|uniref:hypothetical protein n=1 Tax=Maribacter sp. X9 TaxID=3402159 RepID=UPI003AF3F93C